jgi:hypothetical protein
MIVCAVLAALLFLAGAFDELRDIWTILITRTLTTSGTIQSQEAR